LTPQPTAAPSSTDFLTFLNLHPVITWILVALLALIVLTILFKIATAGSPSTGAIKRWFKGRSLKAKVPGVEISIGPDESIDAAATPPHSPSDTYDDPPQLPVVADGLYEAILDFGDYRDKLRDEEMEQLAAITHRAREITRVYKDDFVAQMKLLNHELYSRAKGPMSDSRDHHFNTICRGEIQMLLTKELLDIFDKNHFFLMGETQYREEMETHFHRIKRLVFAAFGEDWYHPDYSLAQFQEAMEVNIGRGMQAHMNLMLKYKQLSNQRIDVKERTRRLSKEARDHIRRFGCLPNGCSES
jgi:hypothetical protein